MSLCEIDIRPLSPSLSPSLSFCHQDQAAKDKVMLDISTMSSSQIVSASAMQQRAGMFGTPGITGNAVPMHTMLTSPSKCWRVSPCNVIVPRR